MRVIFRRCRRSRWSRAAARIVGSLLVVARKMESILNDNEADKFILTFK